MTFKNSKMNFKKNISVLCTSKNKFCHSIYKDFATLWRGWKNGAAFLVNDQGAPK
jgi:hypothetical protein